MKKIFLCIFVVILFLCGCNGSKDTNNNLNNISKAQEISVVSSDTSSVIQTITDKDEIEEFVSAMVLDEWTLGQLPKDAKEVGFFMLSQEQTIKLEQNETDNKPYDIGKITVYADSHVSLEIAGMSVVFKVTDDTASYLRKYF